jgi:hypothetical protein
MRPEGSEKRRLFGVAEHQVEVLDGGTRRTLYATKTRLVPPKTPGIRSGNPRKPRVVKT